jgi:ribosomal protein S18 acetylase RimI-like enzyme
MAVMTTFADPPETTDETAVRRATPADLPALSRVMAGAFYDDPSNRAFYFRERTRRRRLERFFAELSLPPALAHGAVFTTSDLAGGAIWLPSEAMHMGLIEQARLMVAVARISGAESSRVLRTLAVLDRVHPDEPHWFLPQIGVAPERQGRGLGSALLRPMLDHLDAIGMPAYLESTSARGRPLYERHGFEAYDVVTLPGGADFTLMWREPGRRG